MTKTRIPGDARRVPLRPLALGEATGHAHRLVSMGAVAVEEACQMYEWDDGGVGKVGLRITAGGISLIHAGLTSELTADHELHTVLPGEYEVVIQQEETDWGRRAVMD